MKRYMVLFFCMCFTHVLSAVSHDDAQDANDLRILDLLPNLLCPLAVEPEIPSDFVAMSPDGNLNLCDWIY